MIQLQFINYILDKSDFSIITLNNLNKSYFPEYENEFNYIKTHFDSYGNVPDKTSFLNKFPNFDIINVNESKEYLINELYKETKTRYLTSTFNQIRSLIMKDKTEEAETLLNKLIEEKPQFTNIKSVDILSDISRYDRYLDKCNDYSKFYIKTGFPELDKVIGGWDKNEDLVTIVGRPGIGKSFILFKCALAAAEQGLTVGLYEGEMSEDSVGYRIDSLVSHLSNGQIMHGNVNIQEEYKHYLHNIKDKVKGSIKILTPNSLGGPAGISALRAFIERDKLDVLYVDQYSLLEDDRGAKNPIEKTSNISKDLKNLQVLKKIPIISASQQNREKEEDGNVSLRQIAASDRIGQDSSVVIFLDQKDGILTLNVVKARFGGSGASLKYKVDYDKGIYTYIPTEEDGSSSISEQELEDIKNSYNIPNEINVSGGNPF